MCEIACFSNLTLNNVFIFKGARVPEGITIRLIGITVHLLTVSEGGNVQEATVCLLQSLGHSGR